MIRTGVAFVVLQIFLAKITTSVEIEWRMGVIDNKFRWPNAIVPFVMAKEEFDYDQENVIYLGMKEIETQTCIKFVPLSNQWNYIALHKDPVSCSSFVGMLNQGPQAVLLAPHCIKNRSVVHELLHALGLVHTIASTDRDYFVDIDYSMIKPKAKHNFKKVEPGAYSYYYTNYDVESVMHYRPEAFSINRRVPTIKAKRPGDAAKMGRSDHLSKGDVERINAMYCQG